MIKFLVIGKVINHLFVSKVAIAMTNIVNSSSQVKYVAVSREKTEYTQEVYTRNKLKAQFAKSDT